MKNKLIHRAPNGCQTARHDREHRLAKQAIHAAIAVVFVVACTLVRVGAAAPATALQAHSAQEILATVRMQQVQQEIDLQGQLRENEIVVPFRLTQAGPVIKYSFANPAEALQLRLGENDSRLEELSSSGVAKITPAQFDRKVRGTAVTYEDLALKFLYWPDGRVLGEDSIRTRNCWKLQLRAPAKSSQYANVVLWVDKEGGALMRMEGYGWDGQLAKRFEVVSAQKIDGRWFLKQMRIEAIDPGTGKVRSRTYLEIKK